MFILRPWRETDAENVARYANDARVAVNLRDVFPHPYALADAESFIGMCMRSTSEGELYRAIVVDGRAAGGISVCAGGDVYRRSAELGYWLGAPFWGQGIMTAAVGRICREGKLICRDNTRYEPDRMSMRGLGMYEGYTHLANIFLSASFGDLREPIWDMLERERECEGGVTLLPEGDLAVRILGNRAQILEEAAERIKGLARKGAA